MGIGHVSLPLAGYLNIEGELITTSYMKSSAETFEISMCGVVSSKIASHQPGRQNALASTRRTRASLPCPQCQAAHGHSGGWAVGERDAQGDPRTETLRDRGTQRQTVRNCPRKGEEEKREVKRHSEGEKE